MLHAPDRVASKRDKSHNIFGDLLDPWTPIHIAPSSLRIHKDLGAQELTFLEFFAGRGNCWRAMRAHGENSVGIDIKDFQGHPNDHNPFDILSPAGFAFQPYWIYACEFNAMLGAEMQFWVNTTIKQM